MMNETAIIDEKIKEFKAEMYADHDDNMRTFGRLARMIIVLANGKHLDSDDVEWLKILINDAENAHKFDYFMDEQDK